jgi:hypothetical protein
LKIERLEDIEAWKLARAKIGAFIKYLAQYESEKKAIRRAAPTLNRGPRTGNPDGRDRLRRRAGGGVPLGL